MRDAYSDRQEIHDVVLRYCQGIDQARLRGRSPRAPRSAPVAATSAKPAKRSEPRRGPGAEARGGVRSELFGDDALAETYVTAVHWHDEGGFTTGARYVDHLTFRDGRWAIQERWAVREWLRPENGVLPASTEEPRSTRDRTDPVQRLRARLDCR